MLVYLILGITVLLSVISFRGLYLSGRIGFADGWARIAGNAALALFVYLYGAWVYLSIYFKYVHAGLAVLVFITALLLEKKVLRMLPVWRKVVHGFALVLFGTLSVLYFTGTTGKPETVELQFPLKHGDYFVLQGGKGLPANFFHYGYRGAVYAMDLSRLDKRGRRASRIFSPRLDDYYIFADTIYSPCNGVIGMAHDDNPNNIPPSRKRGPTNTNGVLIEADSFYLFMGHLKHGGVFVHEGDVVKTGQPIGLVGNSGFTLEPHLHLQAHKRTGKDAWYMEEQLYIHFDGRGYLLFETIKPKKVEMVR
jgi:hypothetical protein